MAKTDPVCKYAIEFARLCSDDKCQDLAILDLRELSAVTDYFVIATGTSDRQIRSAADHLLTLAKEKGIKILGADGYETANWILLDFVDIVVHIFSPSYRRLYDLELLWGDAPKIRWQRRLTKKKI